MSDGGDWSGGGGFGGGSFTEVSSQGWFSRIGGALIGIPIGLIMFLASFVVLFWNEGRSVRTARSLAEGQKAVVSVTADRVDPANESALIHVSGTATTDETLKDPQFPVSARALSARAGCEDVPVDREAGDPHPQEDWRRRGADDRVHLQQGLGCPPGRLQPLQGPIRPREPPRLAIRGPVDGRGCRDAGRVQALPRPGSPDQQVRAPAQSTSPRATPCHRTSTTGCGSTMAGSTRGRTQAPQVGDVSVEFRQVLPTEVSLLAQQVGGSFRPYQTKSGDAINRLQLGVVSAADMFHAAEAENNFFTWGLRLLGFVLMSAGIGMVLRPLAVVADLIPFIGNVIRFGTGFVAMGIGLVLSLVTIALGWITYRPLVGLAILALAGLALFGFLRLARRRRTAPGNWQNSPSPA